MAHVSEGYVWKDTITCWLTSFNSIPSNITFTLAYVFIKKEEVIQDLLKSIPKTR